MRGAIQSLVLRFGGRIVRSVNIAPTPRQRGGVARLKARFENVLPIFCQIWPIAPVSIWGRCLGGASSRRYFPKSWPSAGEAVSGNRPYVGIAPSQGVLGMLGGSRQANHRQPAWSKRSICRRHTVAIQLLATARIMGWPRASLIKSEGRSCSIRFCRAFQSFH
jgi:hypothetical protein